MAFTDHGDLYGSIHEEGINLVVRHIIRQRPSLFNYGTAYFEDHPEQLCVKIDAAPEVREAGDPLFSEQAKLPTLRPQGTGPLAQGRCSASASRYSPSPTLSEGVRYCV